MKPSTHLLSTIQLKNGLSLSFYDRSNPLAGNRWQVKLFISVPIPIERSLFDMCEDPQGAYATVIDECGHQVAFEQEKVRNFIDASEKDRVLETLRKDFLESNLEYLEKPDFSRRYILKRLEEVDRERYCRQAHLTAISRTEEGN